MLRDELRRPLALLRPVALALAVLAAAMAGVRWEGTSRFLAEARHGQGVVLAVDGAGRATVGFPAGPGREGRFVTWGAAGAVVGASVPVAFVAAPGGPVEARLDTPRALWAAAWSWVEAALGLVLRGVYGRALVEEPSAVIGFKSWRLFGGRRRG